MSAEFKDRLKEAMKTRNIQAAELARITGVSKARISQYMNGIYTPKSKATYIIAEALGVRPAWLMGYDVPMDTDPVQDTVDLSIYGISPIKKVRLPLLGDIACGEPIYANEEQGVYVDVDDDYGADFCLRARGESMINARIYDGDIVFIRKQEMVDNGEIAAVIIDDEATLKRFYYFRAENKLVLQAENPKYPPLVYTGTELDTIHVLGKAVAFQSRL